MMSRVSLVLGVWACAVLPSSALSMPLLNKFLVTSLTTTGGNRLLCTADVLHGAQANLTISDLRGRGPVRTVSLSPVAGKVQFAWDGTDDKGNPLASGKYFFILRVESGGKAENAASWGFILVAAQGTAKSQNDPISAVNVDPGIHLGDAAHVTISALASGSGEVLIVADGSAQVLLKHPIKFSKGNNAFMINLLDTSGTPLPAGAYHVVCHATAPTDGPLHSEKFRLDPGEFKAAALGGASGGASTNSASSASGTPGGSGANARPSQSAGTPDASTPHDNGWHNGANPNGVSVNHDDKSNGTGNNHH